MSTRMIIFIALYAGRRRIACAICKFDDKIDGLPDKIGKIKMERLSK
ncbi:hypothetical protein ACFL6W_02410 [Thermodesulfobacteriota bacterium]